nr:MAG TPA: hypothetical protein [Caudoviricetes sp.]
MHMRYALNELLKTLLFFKISYPGSLMLKN